MSARRRSPVPTGTVLFITSTTRSSSCGMPSITRWTRERSASPECVGGVSTQTNTTWARANTSAMSSVNSSRSRLRSSSRSMPGS